MPRTTFSGFAGGVTIRNLPIETTNPGNTFWVSSLTGSDGNPGTFDKPFGTIDRAINACTANRGDVVYVKPGHVETITAAGGITQDVAGVAVIGTGRGALQPTVNFTTSAAATWLVSASSCTIQNIRFVAGFADIVRLIHATTALELMIDGCVFLESDADLNYIDAIDCAGGDNSADGLTVTNCSAYAVDDAVDSFIQIAGNIERLVVVDNFINHDNANAEAVIEQATGKTSFHTYVCNNSFATLKTNGDMIFDNDAATNDGIVAYNLIAHRDTAGEVLVDVTGVGLFENRGTASANSSGFVLPNLDS